MATLCIVRRYQILGFLFVGLGLHVIDPLTVTTFLAWAVLSLGVLAAATAVVGKVTATLLAQRALGIRIGLLSGENQPPLRDEEAYLEWCNRNGLTPYSAS
jgi:Na+/H+-dicarboxylate symporter